MDELQKSGAEKYLKIGYKALCVVILVFFLVGALGMVNIERYYDAAFGLIPISTIIYLFNKPNLKSIGVIILSVAVAMFLVGLTTM